ncbi:hypothetical protein, partial [Staphylococcus saprophyticus]|uniref:hypothetical protein n=1 Tax=Staphylococcus saprophyticus TaxID=29385 RepID=UPI000D457DA5
YNINITGCVLKLKKHDPFDELEEQKSSQKRGLRQIMIDNDHYESKDRDKKRFPLFMMIIILLFIATGIISILTL